MSARCALALCATLAACGRSRAPVVSASVPEVTASAGDDIIALLPDGAQVLVELDLARLRTNPVVGELVTKVLTGEGLPPLPAAVPVSPLARADVVVLASYGVGSAQAATIVVLETTEQVEGAVRVGERFAVLGPAEWVAQVEARAAIAHTSTGRPLRAAAELLALRDRAMPAEAPGAALRITARLPFDARVTLARETGLDSAPAQVSIWGDVVDDLAIIIDADAADPGDAKSQRAGKQLEAGMRGVIEGVADLAPVRALGIPSSLRRARLVARGTWVRAIIAIGPAHLKRVVERATVYLSGAS